MLTIVIRSLIGSAARSTRAIVPAVVVAIATASAANGAMAESPANPAAPSPPAANPAAADPFPRIDAKSPEQARDYLQWLSRRAAAATQDASSCVPMNFLLLAGSFPRTDPLDKVFKEHRSQPGIIGALADYRLGAFKDHLDLLESDDPCVRQYAGQLLAYDIRARADAEGREANAKQVAAIKEAVSAQGGEPHVFDDTRPPRLWRNLAVIESTAGKRGVLHVLLRDGDAWRYVGSRNLWAG